MEFYTALEEIRIKNKAAYALNQSEKAIFIMEYDADLERYAEILIYYSKDLDGISEEEDVLNIEESLEEFPFVEDLDFILIEKIGMSALGLAYDFAIAELKENEIV